MQTQSATIIKAAIDADQSISPTERKRILEVIRNPATTAPLETLSRIQVAKIFGVHPGSLKRWDRAGRLHPIHVTPRTVRYDKREVMAIVEGSK
jgi:hypothetical protein